MSNFVCRFWWLEFLTNCWFACRSVIPACCNFAFSNVGHGQLSLSELELWTLFEHFWALFSMVFLCLVEVEAPASQGGWAALGLLGQKALGRQWGWAGAAGGACCECWGRTWVVLAVKFVPFGKQWNHPAEGCAGQAGCPLLQYFNMWDQDTMGTGLRHLLWKIQEFSKQCALLFNSYQLLEGSATAMGLWLH